MGGNSEATAIADAFADEVKTLYKVLVDNLARNEANAVQKFASGLGVARQARDAALQAAGPQTAARGAGSRAKTRLSRIGPAEARG